MINKSSFASCQLKFIKYIYGISYLYSYLKKKFSAKRYIDRPSNGFSAEENSLQSFVVRVTALYSCLMSKTST